MPWKNARAHGFLMIWKSCSVFVTPSKKFESNFAEMFLVLNNELKINSCLTCIETRKSWKRCWESKKSWLCHRWCRWPFAEVRLTLIWGDREMEFGCKLLLQETDKTTKRIGRWFTLLTNAEQYDETRMSHHCGSLATSQAILRRYRTCNQNQLRLK